MNLKAKIQAAANRAANGPGDPQVEGGRRKTVTNIPSPYGDTKIVEKFDRSGRLKSQKFVDKDRFSGKTNQVTKIKIDKEGNEKGKVRN